MSINFMHYNFENQQPLRPNLKTQGQQYQQQQQQQHYPSSFRTHNNNYQQHNHNTQYNRGFYFHGLSTTPEAITSPFTSPPPPASSASPSVVSAPSSISASASPGITGMQGLQLGGQRMSEDAPSTQLFISNIPSKVREEEIVSLFRPFPGFISGRLRRTKMNNYIAFVEFDSVEHSGKAKDMLNGYNFDTKTVPSNNTSYTRQQIKQFGITVDFSRAQQQSYHPTQQPPIAVPPPVCTSNDHNFPFNSNDNLEEVPYILHPDHMEIEGSATLYVEGLPQDCTKREASHIFRRFSGFKDLRIIPKEDKFTKSTFLLCFVDFESREDAKLALNSIQDYRMDLEHPEERGLTVFFAKTNKKVK